MSGPVKSPTVRYQDETDPIPCPYGDVRRVVTAGEGGVANVHVVSVTEGKPHRHAGYDEVYYVLRGMGEITMAGQTHALRPGAVVVIPAGVTHSLSASGPEPLQFIIFGTPPVPIDDPCARPEASPES